MYLFDTYPSTVYQLPIQLDLYQLTDQFYFQFIEFRMFIKVVSDPEEIPIPQRDRSSTDVCCTILAAILAITLLTIAAFNCNKVKTHEIYFSTFAHDNNSIAYNDYHAFKITIFYTFIITVSLGIIWITVVQLFPDKVSILAYSLSILLLVSLAILSFTIQNTMFDQHYFIRILAFTICLVLIIILCPLICCYSQQIEFQTILLKYSVRFLSENTSQLLYILLFLFMFCALIVLFLFQHLGFSNITHSNHNFFDFLNPKFLGFLNILEFLWGIQFLKNAFIFTLSGNAIDWYWSGVQDNQQSSSLDRLLCKNWGSVLAGSFMNTFLKFPSNLVWTLVCYPSNTCQKCKCIKLSCNWFSQLIGMMRTDSYSYINIFGTSYCDSGKQCQKLCQTSQHFIGFQYALSNFRMVAEITIVCLSFLLAYLILSFRVKNIDFWFIFDLIILIIGITNFFTCMHTSVGEGIQTSFLVQSYLSTNYDYMQKCIPSLRKELQAFTKKSKNKHQSLE